MASDLTSAESASTVRLHLTHKVAIDLEGARVALSDLAWFGRPAERPAAEPGVRRLVADMELPFSDGDARRGVRKSALIDLGQPLARGDAVVLSVAWQSATLAPLFPVFSGELRVRATGLELVGRYAPPMGRLGLLIDSALLHFVARRTAQSFLSRIASHLTG